MFQQPIAFVMVGFSVRPSVQPQVLLDVAERGRKIVEVIREQAAVAQLDVE